MQRKYQNLILAVIGAGMAWLFAGCFSVPFEKPRLVPVPADIKAEAVAERFAEQLPPVFETENTLIFRFWWREIAALGYARVDRQNDTFEVLCMNHLGVQIFHISGDADGNHLRYAIPEFDKHEGFVDAVGNDIRRVYFNLVPGREASSLIKRDRIIFSHDKEEQEVYFEYVFGGPEMLLLEKRVFERSNLVSTISFYEYDLDSGYAFPKGIVLHNRRHNYRLIIRTRDTEFEALNLD